MRSDHHTPEHEGAAHEHTAPRSTEHEHPRANHDAPHERGHGHGHGGRFGSDSGHGHGRRNGHGTDHPTLARSIMKSARRIRRSGLTPEQLQHRIAATVSHADYVTTMRTLRRVGMDLRGQR